MWHQSGWGEPAGAGPRGVRKPAPAGPLPQIFPAPAPSLPLASAASPSNAAVMTILGPDIPKYPIGISDYAKLRRGGFTYVDKTSLIAEILDAPGETKLIPRPRRFGKTLNVSMLQYYFEQSNDDRSDLFSDTWIWEADDGSFREHFQRYPVISVTFKDIKATSWAGSWKDIRALLRAELKRLRGAYDLEAIVDDAGETADWLGSADRAEAEPSDLTALLHRLSSWLTEATGERVVILIDEYDATLHAAWEHGYWDEAIAFFRSFLSGGLKDATHLYRGVLTGILKVAKENIFSGLNNIDTYSLFSPYITTPFGFTEDEVRALADRAALRSELGMLRAWYNGYRFGGVQPTTMYNPWSVLQFLSKPDSGPQAYWKNSSSNALVRDLLVRHARAAGPDVTTLLTGDTIDKTIDENVVLSDLADSSDALWSLLTFSGYLTAEDAAPTAQGYDVSLRIPNREVDAVFRTTFSDLLRRSGDSNTVPELLSALLDGSEDVVEATLERLLVGAMSVHDFGREPIEAVYQAFIVGLLIQVDATHRVTSNREAGFGRADVLVTPREEGGRGAVLELKSVTRRETPESALDRALDQLRDRNYAAEVLAAGASTVHEYGVVFDGKRCWVKMVV